MDPPVGVEQQELDSARDRVATCKRCHLPADPHAVVMGLGGPGRLEYVALPRDELLVGRRDPFRDRVEPDVLVRISPFRRRTKCSPP